jgi:hypothetical protein
MFLILLALRTGAALALLLWEPAGLLRVGLVAGIAVLTIAPSTRSPFGLDGADQMSVITFVGLTLAHLGSSPVVQKAFLWFIALQACLSYATAGWAKVAAPRWRSGEYLTSVFATLTYGHAGIARFLAPRRQLTAFVARSMILMECVLPLALVLPAPGTLALLAVGVLFHLSAALIMGLNTFFWSFVAAYPAIFYCASTWR